MEPGLHDAGGEVEFLAEVRDGLGRIHGGDRVRPDELGGPIAGIEQADLELGPLAPRGDAGAPGHLHPPATPLARLEVGAAPRHQIRLVGLDHARRPHFAFRGGVDHFDGVSELPPITRVGLDAPGELGPARSDPERVTDAPVPASQRDDAQWNGHNTGRSLGTASGVRRRDRAR